MSTSRPTARKIAVALEALRDDADKWALGAGRLQQASAQLAFANLDPTAFGFVGGDVAQAYARLQARAAELLRGATTNFGNVASALRESADTYEREERANVHRLHNLY